jgi:hypothetical protein
MRCSRDAPTEVSVIGLHACEEHVTDERVPPRTATPQRDTDEIDKPKDVKQDERDDLDADSPPPIVEERLLVCIDALRCLQRLARLAQQNNDIPPFSSLFRFARITNQFARALEGHLRAVTDVLPAKATDLPAPGKQERV